eukprot:TRINITY_DN828_c0_g1_i5.p1 TRINITY_DN828_c0_g1~~TRINITY_DN828_c0_g1_i5.p1  ORF type:complete len:235 (+),score=75.53 TRINITY_DN828_c0_g1_i5:946-1650(+)
MLHIVVSDFSSDQTPFERRMGDAGQLVRLKKGKATFEVVTNEGSVLKYREGKLPWNSVLAVDIVFKNFSRGLRASEKEIADAFNTEDPVEAMKAIVEKGELQVSSDERKEAVDKKKAEIITYINKNYIDPQTRLPHPIARLEQAMENSKIRIDADQNAVKQADAFIKSLQGKLTFVKSEMEAILVISRQYMGACSNTVHSIASVKREEYTEDGVIWEVGIPPAGTCLKSSISFA